MMFHIHSVNLLKFKTTLGDGVAKLNGLETIKIGEGITNGFFTVTSLFKNQNILVFKRSLSLEQLEGYLKNTPSKAKLLYTLMQTSVDLQKKEDAWDATIFVENRVDDLLVSAEDHLNMTVQDRAWNAYTSSWSSLWDKVEFLRPVKNNLQRLFFVKPPFIKIPRGGEPYFGGPMHPDAKIMHEGRIALYQEELPLRKSLRECIIFVDDLIRSTMIEEKKRLVSQIVLFQPHKYRSGISTSEYNTLLNTEYFLLEDEARRVRLAALVSSRPLEDMRAAYHLFGRDVTREYSTSFSLMLREEADFLSAVHFSQKPLSHRVPILPPFPLNKKPVPISSFLSLHDVPAPRFWAYEWLQTIYGKNYKVDFSFLLTKEMKDLNELCPSSVSAKQMAEWHAAALSARVGTVNPVVFKKKTIGVETVSSARSSSGRSKPSVETIPPSRNTEEVVMLKTKPQTPGKKPVVPSTMEEIPVDLFFNIDILCSYMKCVFFYLNEWIEVLNQYCISQGFTYSILFVVGIYSVFALLVWQITRIPVYYQHMLVFVWPYKIGYFFYIFFLSMWKMIMNFCCEIFIEFEKIERMIKE